MSYLFVALSYTVIRGEQDLSQIQGQMYKHLFRSSSWPKATSLSRPARQRLGMVKFWEGLPPFCGSGVYITPCRGHGKHLARLGFEFMLLEPCSNFSTEATHKSELIISTEINPAWFCLMLLHATAHLWVLASGAGRHGGRRASARPHVQHRQWQSNKSLET